MKNNRQGAAELARMMAKGKLLNGPGSTIITPEQALQARQASYKAEWQDIWHLRESLVQSLVASGSTLPAVALVDRADELAKELKARRCIEALVIAEATGQTPNEGFAWVAGVLGVEVPEAEPPGPPTLAEQPKLIQGPGAA